MSQTNGEGFFIWQIRWKTLINFREKQDPQRRNRHGEYTYKEMFNLASNSGDVNWGHIDLPFNTP